MVAELIRTVLNNHPHSTNPKRYLRKGLPGVLRDTERGIPEGQETTLETRTNYLIYTDFSITCAM